jgi:hypothetical protein
MKFGRALILAAAVSIAASGAHANLLVNSGFETPDLLGNPTPVFPSNLSGIPGNYAYPGASGPATFAGWTYDGGAGLINTSGGSNAWYGNSPPSGSDGIQFAFVQGSGTLSQTFISSVAGSASINWLAGGRPDFGPYNGAQQYDVFLNSSPIGTFSTTSGQAFAVTTGTGLLTVGSNTLSFKGAGLGDNTAFVDDVNVAAVPEPATWAMLLLGFAGLGFVGYRRKNKMAFKAA